MALKQQLASQLENVMQVSNNTITGLEKDKRSLLDERSLLHDQVAGLQAQKSILESRLSEVLNELSDRNSMKQDLYQLRSQLKTSVELIAATVQQSSCGSHSFDQAKLVEDLTRCRSDLIQVNVDASKDKTDLASVTAALAQSRINEAQLRTELECSLKRQNETKAELLALRSAAANSQSNLGVHSSASISSSDVQAHPEYLRLQSQLAAARKELERVRSSEVQLRDEITQLRAKKK